jgi:hypothetical protein
LSIITPPAPVGAEARRLSGNPLSVISVVDAPYNCIDDGLSGIMTVTYTANTTGLKCVTQASAVVTVANNGPNGVATVVFGNPTGSTFDGRGPNDTMVNKTIAITCPNTSIFVSRVASFTYDTSNSLQRLTLTDAAPANLATGAFITTQYACPCFQVPGNPNYYVGKSIILENGGATSGTSAGALTGNPGYYVPLYTTIASITDAYNIVLATNITAVNSASLQPPQMLVRFGTNNTGDSTRGFVRAGLAAWQGRKDVWFPGLTKPGISTGTFFMFQMFPNSGSTWSAANLNASLAYANTRHFTSNAEATFISECIANNAAYQDIELPAKGIPYTEDMGRPVPLKGVFGAASLPRCASIPKGGVIKATVIGDSWAGFIVFGQATNTPAMELVRQFEAQNPGVTVAWDYRGVGGTKFWDIISGVNLPPAATNVPWSTGTHPYLFYATNHSAGGSPDIIFVHSGGVNDGGSHIHSNDVLGVYNTLRAITPTLNGLPPDVVFMSYGARLGQIINAGNIESGGWDDEYGATMVANIAKANSIPLIELGPTLAYLGAGWSRYNTRMRLQPNCPQAVVTSLVPYHIPYKCYNYWVAVKLVGTGGADFWGRATTLEFVISAKDDNRIVIGLDGSNNLTVRAQLWGRTISTTLSIANGSKALTTSGQTNVNPNHGFFPNPPTYSLSASTVGTFAGTQGQSLLFNGIGLTAQGLGQRDFRTFGVGANAGTITWCCDGNGQTNTCTSMWWGGHMFTPGDALANADVILTSGGVTLKTKCATGGYTDFQNMALQDAWAGSTIAAAATSMFLGKITYGPGYQAPIAAGTDATGNGYIVLEVLDNEAWVGYVPGAAAVSSNPMVNIGNIQTVWFGKIERPGAMFYPRIYISNPSPSSAVNIQAVMVTTGEPLLFRPSMSVAQMFPTLSPDQAGSFYGGDGSHFSQEVAQRGMREIMKAQDFCTRNGFGSYEAMRTVTAANTPAISDLGGAP